MQSPHDILGVKPDASPMEIKKAFRALCLRVHPDQGGNAALFKIVSEAYEALKDGKQPKKESPKQEQKTNTYSSPQEFNLSINVDSGDTGGYWLVPSRQVHATGYYVNLTFEWTEIKTAGFLWWSKKKSKRRSYRGRWWIKPNQWDPVVLISDDDSDFPFPKGFRFQPRKGW